MSHTFSNLIVHLVWSTKNRVPFLKGEIKCRMHGYLRKVINDLGANALFINGMEDHVHVLMVIPLTLLIPDLIEKVKPASTKWVRKTFTNVDEFSWQEGYGAFSVGKANLQQVIKYIENQEEHHRKVTFEEEFIRLLEASGIHYDKRFVFN